MTRQQARLVATELLTSSGVVNPTPLQIEVIDGALLVAYDKGWSDAEDLSCLIAGASRREQRLFEMVT